MYLIIVYLLFYVFLAIYRIDWAVMFLIAALPAYLIRFNILAVPFTLLEAMILISFAVWFLDNYKEIFKNLKLRIKVSSSKFSAQGRSASGGQVPSFIRYPFDVEIVLLLIVSFIAAGISGFSASAMGIWKAYFFEPALVFILAFNAFGKHTNGTNTERKQRMKISGVEKILWPLAVSAFVVSMFAIYQKFTGAFIFNELWAAEETRRVTSFFGYPNAVGLYLGPIILILLGWIFNQYSKTKPKNLRQDIKEIFNFSAQGGPASGWQFLIFPPKADQPRAGNFQFLKLFFINLTIILSLSSIYFAKSEGAMIGIAAGLLVFGLSAGKKIRWVVATLILLALIGIINFQPLRDYAVKKITLHDLSGEIRKQQWRETWQMLAASPLRFALGAGLANYKNAVAPYHQEGIFFNRDNDPEFHRHVVWDAEYKKSHWQPTEIYLYPHNIIFNFWSELGLAGMLLFVWIIIKYFVVLMSNVKCQMSNVKFINIGLICAMVAIVVHGFVDVPYFKNDLAVMFWLLIALMGLINLKFIDNKN